MTASQSNSLNIVLNYASGDERKANPVYKFLKSQNINVWSNEKSVLPGQKREFETENAVENADLIIVCLSSKSVAEEGYVQKVRRLALDKSREKRDDSIFLIPLRLDECNVPAALEQWTSVDIFDPEWQAKLLKSIGLRAKNLGKSVSLPGKGSVGWGAIQPSSTLSQTNEPPVSCFWPRVPKPLGNLVPHPNLPDRVDGNPFPHLDAEADLKYLFSRKNFFWNGHPLIQSLKQRNEITVVTGPSGVGKTALARAHGIYLIDKYTFSCCFKQPLSFSETQRAFAEIALDFITDNPFYLPLTTPELKLLAGWLAANLGDLIISAQISRATRHFEDAEWFKEAGPKSQRQEWKKQAGEILGRLDTLVESVDQHEYPNFRSWNVFQQCVKSLAFNKVRAVFDLNKNLSSDQRGELHEFIQHHATRAEIVLFGQPDSNWIQDVLENGATLDQLAWSAPRSSLEKMVRHRWGIVSRDPFESMFRNGALEHLFEVANGNPRYFIQIWNRVLDLKKTQYLISKQLIEKANQ